MLRNPLNFRSAYFQIPNTKSVLELSNIFSTEVPVDKIKFYKSFYKKAKAMTMQLHDDIKLFLSHSLSVNRSQVTYQLCSESR